MASYAETQHGVTRTSTSARTNVCVSVSVSVEHIYLWTLASIICCQNKPRLKVLCKTISDQINENAIETNFIDQS